MNDVSFESVLGFSLEHENSLILAGGLFFARNTVLTSLQKVKTASSVEVAGLFRAPIHIGSLTINFHAIHQSFMYYSFFGKLHED